MKRIVIGVVPEAEKLTRLSANPAAREGCRAQQFLDDHLCRAQPTAGTHLQHAQHAVAFYNTAGFDHMRAFVTVLRTGRHIFPLATLTRGAVEAFAKANYLLGSTSAADLILRYVGLACSELRFSVRYSGFALLDGTQVDGNAHLEELSGLPAQLGLGKAAQPSLTTLASDLLSEGAPGVSGREFYSQLSSVAHGETSGVTMFIDSDFEEGLRFFHRREVLVPYAGMLFATCRTVMNKVVDHFGIEQDHRDRWRGVTERAELWIEELRDSDPRL
ncbi:hypothetical protein [uncultured Arthrobacter sp.]|uniref:hypothetical protein n=1 Tax=uncultured Arthrobacter sp. TaxID=114050 RepID=UPI0028D5FE6F|nr:hypothetical protein [uncultured Arthrobacter sp.]